MEFEWDPAKEAQNLAKHISARRARKNEEEEYQKHVERKAPDDRTEAGADDQR